MAAEHKLGEDGADVEGEEHEEGEKGRGAVRRSGLLFLCSSFRSLRVVERNRAPAAVERRVGELLLLSSESGFSW